MFGFSNCKKGLFLRNETVNLQVISEDLILETVLNMIKTPDGQDIALGHVISLLAQRISSELETLWTRLYDRYLQFLPEYTEECRKQEYKCLLLLILKVAKDRTPITSETT